MEEYIQRIKRNPRLLMIVAAILLLLLFGLFLGIFLNFYVIIVLSVWIILFALIFLERLKLSKMLFTIVLVSLSILSILVVSSNAKNGTKNRNTANLKEVSREIYDIRSADGKITGVAGLIEYSTGVADAFYNIAYNLDLKSNWVCKPNQQDFYCASQAAANPYEYNYVMKLASDNTTTTRGYSYLSQTHCNIGLYPSESSDIFSTNFRGWTLEQCSEEIRNNTWKNPVTHFNTIFRVRHNDKESFLKSVNLYLYDAKNYWESEDANTSVLNTKRTIENEQVIQNYQVELKKR